MKHGHQTIKAILCKFSIELDSTWDEAFLYCLFVMRDMLSENNGFNASASVLAHSFKGPLYQVKSRLLGSEN